MAGACLQRRWGDKDRKKVMGLLVHGDAAYAGLGIVAECAQLSSVEGTSHPCAPPSFAHVWQVQ